MNTLETWKTATIDGEVVELVLKSAAELGLPYEQEFTSNLDECLAFHQLKPFPYIYRNFCADDLKGGPAYKVKLAMHAQGFFCDGDYTVLQFEWDGKQLKCSHYFGYGPDDLVVCLRA